MTKKNTTETLKGGIKNEDLIEQLGIAKEKLREFIQSNPNNENIRNILKKLEQINPAYNIQKAGDRGYNKDPKIRETEKKLSKLLGVKKLSIQHLRDLAERLEKEKQLVSPGSNMMDLLPWFANIMPKIEELFTSQETETPQIDEQEEFYFFN